MTKFKSDQDRHAWREYQKVALGRVMADTVIVVNGGTPTGKQTRVPTELAKIAADYADASLAEEQARR